MSANFSLMARKMVFVIVACMMVATPFAEGAMSCGFVVGKLGPCFNYLTSKGRLPPTCCDGVKGLMAAARNTVDCQTACRCLKYAASGIPNIDLARAGSLPGKCGVYIPYKISPYTDCTKVM